MSFYEQNMKAIDERKHYFLKKIEENKDKLEPDNKMVFRTIEAKDNTPVLVIETEGRSCRMNSAYSPEHEAKRWIKQFDMRNLGIVISMFGLGDGTFVREIMKRLKEEEVLLLYEPSPQLFRYVMEHYDITDILTSERVSVTVEGINDNEIKNLLSNHVDTAKLHSQIICHHPHYDVLFPESCRHFHKIVEDNANRVIVNKNTEVAIGRITVDNMLRNISLLGRCNIVTDLAGSFTKDIPAIIVAAGPSLDKNILDLKQAKGKAAIFAVDTAVKYLLQHDILPDFIVTLDPRKSLHHLENERCKDIPILARIDARPENLQRNEKRVILYNVEGYARGIYDRLGIETGEIRSGGSVATGAFSVCETLGFQRIILVGQDLAYSGDVTHAGGDADRCKRSRQYP